jgi:XTP/dITP diphosphohydrolase
MPYLSGQRLVIATHNTGKFDEFSALLSPYLNDIVSAGDQGLPDVEETGDTFVSNAILKARAAAKFSGYPALADDSGLCVTALANAPGIYSARWGGPQKDFSMAMMRINDELGSSVDRSAFFACALALAWPDGQIETVEGHVEGQIVWPPRGDKGHGYDPIFVPIGHTQTFAEMPPEQKNMLSHRGVALKKIMVVIGESKIPQSA